MVTSKSTTMADGIQTSAKTASTPTQMEANQTSKSTDTMNDLHPKNHQIHILKKALENYEYANNNT